MKSRLARAGVVGAMAIGAVVAVTSFGAPGGAQADATTPIANPGLDSAPAVSHDGAVIAFVSSPDVDGESSIVVHREASRAPDGTPIPAATTAVEDSAGAVNPGLSGNGCVVTWSTPAQSAPVDPEVEPSTEPDPPVTSDPTVDAPADGAGAAEPDTSDPNDPDDVDQPIDVESAALEAAPARVVVLDLCAGPDGVRVDLPLRDDDLSFGPAAASLDGSVIAVSNGTDVLVFGGSTETGYTEQRRVDGTDTDATDHLVGDRVDVSDDGSVIVFSGGTDLADISVMTVFALVADGDEAATTPVLTSATGPTVSGDGAYVVGATGADGSSVAVVDRTAAPLAPIDLGPGRRPAISADGNHVVFEEAANLAIVSRTGQGDAAFATTQRTLLSTTITPTRSGPVIDRLGTTVVSDRDLDPAAPPADTDIAVTAVGADAAFDATVFDLGSGDVGARLATTVTFSNRGPASVGIASIDVDGTFTIVENRCGPVLRPGTTCEVDVEFVVERLEDAFGVITLTPESIGVDAYTAELTALGEAPPAASTSTTTTTRPSSSTGGSTGGTTSGGSSTGGTSSGSSTGGSSTGSTRTTTTTTTTTTLAPGAGVSASPAAFDFAPTIIDAGRRTGLVEIVNNGTGSATIIGVRVEPAEAGPFQIVETTCAGASVAAGSRCGVTLSFAPTTTGDQSVSLIASIEGGVDITVPVTGTGAPAPTVDVVPGVATVGQVVTLRGAGFPTGITIDLTWASTVRQVVIDDAGTFAIPVVVMSHTATGPAEVSVAGQTDMFAAVAGTMIITDTSNRSGPSVIDGVGPNIGR